MSDTTPIAEQEKPAIDPTIMDVILKEKHDALTTVDAELNKYKQDLQILAAILDSVDVEAAVIAQLLITKNLVTKEELQGTYKDFIEELKKSREKMKEDAAKTDSPPASP